MIFRLGTDQIVEVTLSDLIADVLKVERADSQTRRLSHARARRTLSLSSFADRQDE